MEDPLLICRETALKLDGVIECSLLDMNSGQRLASHIQDPKRLVDSEHFASLAVWLLGSSRQRLEPLGLPTEPSGRNPTECHVEAQHLIGFARLIPQRSAVLVLTVHAMPKVGLGWAALGTAAARLSLT